MLRAFDCAQPVTLGVIARAKANGYLAVGRYLGTPGSGKLLSPGEARSLSEAGLMIFSYFERTAGRPLLGEKAGAADAALAVAQAAAVGQPEGSGICFALDTDADMDDRSIAGAVTGYFTAARAAIEGRYRIGVYGDGEACAVLAAAGLADYEILAGAMGWQGSRLYRTGKLWEGMQYPASGPRENPLGIDMDPVDLVSFDAIGAWTLAGQPPATPAAPVTSVTAAEAIEAACELQRRLKELGLYTGAIDGQIGPKSSAAAMRAYILSRA